MEHLEFTVLVQSKHTLLVYPMEYGLFARDTVRAKYRTSSGVVAAADDTEKD